MNGMEPLWIASDQAQRLAELTAGTADPEKETPLRRDVRSLGVLLGRVLVEQGGEELLEIVEQLRHLLIRRREEPPGSAAQDELMTQARDIIGKMDVKDAHKVTKAFAIYFELTNLAETNHRKRRRRAAKLHAEQPPLAGSFRGRLVVPGERRAQQKFPVGGGLAPVREQQHPVVVRGNLVLQWRHQKGIEDRAQIGDDDPDGPGAARHEAAPHLAWDVPQFRDGGEYSLPGGR